MLVLRPIEMYLKCPACGLRHEDTGEYATKPHRWHLCKPEDGGCGGLFLPCNLDTVGIPWDKPRKEETREECLARLLVQQHYGPGNVMHEGPAEGCLDCAHLECP